MTEYVNEARVEFEPYINKPFEITQEDIDTAVQKNSLKCILAVAIQRFLDDRFQNIVIHPNCATIGFDDKQKWCFYGFSKEVRKLIQNFDEGKSISPVTLCFRYTGSSEYHPELCTWYPKGWNKERVDKVADYYDKDVD